MEGIAPTKANLISAKVSLEFSEKGFELLDKKRNILIMELMSYMERAKVLGRNIDLIFSEAYEALKEANIAMGILRVKEISNSIKKANNFQINYKSVMGVEVPKLLFQIKNREIFYSYAGTNLLINEVIIKFTKVKYLLFELAEVENSMFKLAAEVKKTQRKANALENIQIPKFFNTVKEITAVLEEKEREDFFRLKIVKKKKIKV